MRNPRVALMVAGAVGFAVGLAVHVATAGNSGADGRLLRSALVYAAYAAAFSVPALLTLRGWRPAAAVVSAALLALPMLAFFFGLLAILPGLAFLLAAVLPEERRAPVQARA